VGAYLLVGLLVTKGFILPPLQPGSTNVEVEVNDGIAWSLDEPGALAQAASEGKVTMIDFTADWCAACKELEHLTYTDPRVIDATRDMVTVMVDVTNNDDPEAARLLQKHAVGGLPTVRFLRPDGTAIDDLTISGYVPPEEFLAHIDAAKGAIR